jgi:hypothetical protein
MTEVRTAAGAVTGAGMVAAGMSGVLSSRSTSEGRAAAGTLRGTGGTEGMQWVEAATGSTVMEVSEGEARISGRTGTAAGIPAVSRTGAGTGAEAGAAVVTVGVRCRPCNSSLCLGCS